MTKGNADDVECVLSRYELLYVTNFPQILDNVNFDFTLTVVSNSSNLYLVSLVANKRAR